MSFYPRRGFIKTCLTAAGSVLLSPLFKPLLALAKAPTVKLSDLKKMEKNLLAGKVPGIKYIHLIDPKKEMKEVKVVMPLFRSEANGV
ncbi:MAG: hypothetical protein GXO57_02295, partial [Thermodesulfobacteria bacterium]|nr:hypothetical protein [Thermodesulfobacteriota bacterium]